MVCSRRLVPVLVAATVAATAAGALANNSHGGPLSGTWSGFISGHGVKRQHIVITVNARESGGSWKLSNRCQGPLTLDSISNGYHHYRRRLARGSTCKGGDIDCLKRVRANIYDAVTPRPGGEYSVSGTLHRVRSR